MNARAKVVIRMGIRLAIFFKNFQTTYSKLQIHPEKLFFFFARENAFHILSTRSTEHSLNRSND